MNKNIIIVLFVSLLGGNRCTLTMNETFAVCALKEKPFWWKDKKPRAIQFPPEAEIRAEMLKIFADDVAGYGAELVEKFIHTLLKPKKAFGDCPCYFTPICLPCVVTIPPPAHDSPWALTKVVLGSINDLFDLNPFWNWIFTFEQREQIKKIPKLDLNSSEALMAKSAKGQEFREKAPYILKILLKNHPQEIEKLMEDLTWRPLPSYGEITKY